MCVAHLWSRKRRVAVIANRSEAMTSLGNESSSSDTLSSNSNSKYKSFVFSFNERSKEKSLNTVKKEVSLLEN